jgi:hypothetical protein
MQAKKAKNALERPISQGGLSGGEYFLRKFSRAGMRWKSSIQGKYLHAVQPTPVSGFMSIFFHLAYLAAHSSA